jgi:hypothetical protein
MARITQIQIRRDSASAWSSVNPQLAAGEIGFELDTGKFKIGTGTSSWALLPYATDGSYLLNISASSINSGILSGQYGGTGSSNTGRTISLGGNLVLGGNLTISGSNNLILNTTGSTSLTLPTSGSVVSIGTGPAFSAVVTSVKTHTASAVLEPVFAGSTGTSSGAFNLKANTFYQFRGVLYGTRASFAGTANGVLIGASVSASTQNFVLSAAGYNLASISTGVGHTIIPGNSFLVSNTATSASASISINYQGFIRTNASVGGTFSLMFGQGTAANALVAATPDIQPGSFIEIYEMPFGATGSWS